MDRISAAAARTVLTVIVSLALAPAPATASERPVWVTDSRLGASLLRVDVETGERSLVDLYDYPVVIDIRAGVEAPGGELYLEAVNALSLVTVVRFDPSTGDVTGISGLVHPDGTTVRGSGPDFQPGLRELVVGPWGRLIALRRSCGPMAVDIATGDRRVVSQSVDPPVGSGADMSDPLDLVLEHRGSLLVADRFAGLVRIDPRDGSRRTVFVFEGLVEGPHRVEKLADGRILHALGAGDGRQLTVLDSALEVATELSGPGRGAGPGFVAIADVMVARDGTIHVLDLGLRAILAVDPATGDRRVVADDPVGNDLALLSADARLASATVDVKPAPRRPAGRRLVDDGGSALANDRGPTP